MTRSGAREKVGSADLKSLQYNGGPGMFTMAPKPGSPVLAAGSTAHCAVVDERGVSRSGAPCDLGAYQATSTPRCHVPRLKGRKLKSARKALKRHGCRLGHVLRKHVSSPSKRHRVLRQHPKAGKTLPSGTKVKLVVGF